MNRDCNIEELAYESQDGGKIIRLSDLQDWLTDKKVIKKGLQPHPDADVIHACAEGTECEYKLGNLFVPLEIIGIIRIKPSELVFEWQYHCTVNVMGEIGRTKHLTDEEFNKSTLQSDCWFKDEETKRVRQ